MKLEYADYVSATNVGGSGRASSYLRALDLLGEMIKAEPCGFSDCENIWSQNSIERLEELHAFVCVQQRLGSESIWNLSGIAPSYLSRGFCSAALRDFQKFLAEYRYRKSLIEAFESHTGDEESVVKKFDVPFDYPFCLIDGLTEKEGKEVMRSVKARTNQKAFQTIVMKNFRGLCCITNLEVPAANRASHIIPWAERKTTRMDPRNGLYLSATYDAVFDRNLLSLDDDYRIILSRDLKEHYTSSSYAAHFGSKEGSKISLPVAYLPKREYLEYHRAKGRF